jgi:hypothetical protein
VQYCKDNWCRQDCKKDCKRQEQGINIERCKSYGNDAGWKAAQQACDLTQVWAEWVLWTAKPHHRNSKSAVGMGSNSVTGVGRNRQACGHGTCHALGSNPNSLARCTHDPAASIYSATWIHMAMALA